MGEKQPKKKPLVMDAVKPQGFSEPAEAKEEPNDVDATMDEELAKEEIEAEEESQNEEEPKPEEEAAEEPAPEPEPEPEEEPEEPAEPTPEPTVSGLEDEEESPEPQKTVDTPTFSEQLEQTQEKNENFSDVPTPKPKKERVIFKLLRMIIWLFVAVMLPASIFIMKNSEKAAAYANGTHNAQLSFGQTFFWITLIVGILNFIWGTVRWIMRIVRNHCSVGRIIGKLIGGGIWRFFVFAPIVLISLIFVAPVINNKVRNDALLGGQESTDGRTLIERDFKDGKITVDEYVRYSINYAFDQNGIPEKYRDDSENVQFDFDYSFVEEHLDELSDETLTVIDQIMNLENVDFGTDASKNVSKSSNNQFVQNVSAVEKTVTVLNKAKLSKNGKAIVFYTDTGISAISDIMAEGIGEAIDLAASKVKDVFNFDLQYATQYKESSKKVENIKEVLRANNIEESALDSAIPIFVAQTKEKGGKVLATHYVVNDNIAATIYSRIKNGDEGAFTNSVPVREFIVVQPDMIRTNSDGSISLYTQATVVHEFGHSTQYNYCLASIGSWCNLPYFVGEGTANLLALKTVEQEGAEGFLNVYHQHYVKSSCNSLENSVSEDADAEYDCTYEMTLPGYPTTAFWANYYEIVPNAGDIITKTWAQSENHLQFIYNQAEGTNFRNVMKQSAQRNITFDEYDEQARKAFSTDIRPIGEVLNCTGLCTKQFQMAPASIKYIYLSTQSSVKTEISVQAPNSTAITMYKINGDANEKLTEGNGKAKYTSGSKAENIIIAVANGSIEAADFLITITPEEVKDIFEEKTINFNAKNPFKELDNGCVEVDMDSLLDIPGEISGFIKGINSDIDFSNIIKQLDEVDKDKEETKQHFEGYRISICTIDFKEGTDFATARAKLKKIMKSGLGIINLDFYNSKDDDMNISVFGAIDTFDKSGKVYALIEIEKGMPGLFNINVDPR